MPWNKNSQMAENSTKSLANDHKIVTFLKKFLKPWPRKVNKPTPGSPNPEFTSPTQSETSLRSNSTVKGQSSFVAPLAKTTIFEDIPTELKIAILSQCADLPTLNSLIRASPLYYRAHLESKKSILLSVGVNELPLDAFYSWKAQRLRERRRPHADDQWVRAVKEILVQYREDREKEPPLANSFSWKELKQMLRFHRKVVFLTQDFCESTIAKHPVSGSPEPPEMRGELSSAETLRIHRAFYRFELHRHLFYLGHRYLPATEFGGRETLLKYPELDKNFQASDFLCNFSPWEIQEIACVKDYMVRRHSVLILKVKWDESIDGEVFYEWEGGAPNPDELYEDSRIYRKVLMSRGLSFLSHLLRLSSDTERDKIIRHKLHTDFNDIYEALQLIPGYALKSYTSPESPLNPDLLYAADDGKGPNQAWVWANGGKQLPIRDGYDTKCLRQWGYVMWDLGRLQRWSDASDSKGHKCYSVEKEIMTWSKYKFLFECFGQYGGFENFGIAGAPEY
ncbi:MAG: hypothetical protein M1837_004116 [Sclerophora amabilis]|nr:MAG: hypothetical protein M1837_004116 [Sclerophora amabilis]